MDVLPVGRVADFAACSDDEKGTDEQPGPIIGE